MQSTTNETTQTAVKEESVQKIRDMIDLFYANKHLYEKILKNAKDRN